MHHACPSTFRVPGMFTHFIYRSILAVRYSMSKIISQSGRGGAGTFATILIFATLSVFGAPVPKLNSITPEWIQRGVDTDVVVTGENLDDITQFVLSGEEGVEVEIAPPSKAAVRLESTSENVFSSGAANETKRITAKVRASADVSLGSQEIRVVTRGGVSNPLTIRITNTPEMEEQGNNHSVAEAPKVNLPAGIYGRIRTEGQVDMFRFEAKKGEKIICDVQASRIGSPLDSSLALLDAKGKELARNEDASGMDSRLIFEAPENGEYIAALRDFQHRGGGNYTYHITLGALPWVDSIFPFGGQRGKTAELKLTGVNLEGAETMKVDVASDAPGGPQEVRAYTARGISNPIQFDVSAFPDITEAEPNNAITNATTTEVPGNVNGVISETRDIDVIKFKAGKKQRFIFEIYARRFNSRLDPLLTLMNSKGDVMQRSDDASGADGRIDQTFAEEGDYYISVRDLLDRGGPQFGYRLSIDPPAAADFNAKLLADTVRLNRGGRTIVRVEVARSGFGGAIEIFADNLPRGVTAIPLTVPADFPTGLLQFVAADDAEAGSIPLELKAAAIIGGKREVRPVASVSGVKPLARDKRGRAIKTDGKAVAAAYLTILEAAPFTIDWLTLSADIEQNQTAKVVAELKRRTGFSGDVKITVEGYAAGNEAINRNFDVKEETLKNKDARANINLKAKIDSETGTRPVYARAEASVDGVAVIEHSGPLSFRVAEFPFTLVNSLPRLGVTVPPSGVTTNAASQADFSVKTQRRGLFTDDIALSIEGLPEGMVATSTNLLHGLTEAGFQLTATDTAKVGTNNIAVIGMVNVNGRQFRLRGPDIQLIVNPAAELTETAAAK